MTKKQNFIRFVQIYSSYLMKDDERLTKEESEDLKKTAENFFKSSAIYTCCGCGNKSGLSFIESKHSCKNPMFDKNAIPQMQRVIEECEKYGLDFNLIRSSVNINRQNKNSESKIPPTEA